MTAKAIRISGKFVSVKALKIIKVETAEQVKQFLDLPYDLYKDDPQWRAPLRFERKQHLSPAKNPTLNTISDQKFLAMREQVCVGRIAAFINSAHQDRHNDGAGHIGLWDCEDDPETGRALLAAAEDWLLKNGAKKIIGPCNWSVNEDTGLLVDGFETPPVVLMPYGKPYYQTFIEAAGFEKAIDMYAFHADLNAGYPRPKTTQTMVRLAEKDKRVTWRKVRMAMFKSELEMAMDVFNDAWSENWGFLPFTADQIDHMAKDMKPLIDPDLFLIGEIDGEPAAFITMIPDVNTAAHGLNGKLLPFGFAKFLYRLKVKGVKQARIPLMGLRRNWHNKRQGLALIAQLCETIFANARGKGYSHCELSWILETNASMIRICEQASAQKYKTYRMYEKQL